MPFRLLSAYLQKMLYFTAFLNQKSNIRDTKYLYLLSMAESVPVDYYHPR